MTYAAPQVLTDPGTLYYAIIGSTMPTNTVVGGVFTDAWPVAWLAPGMTADGSEFHPSVTVTPLVAAEQIYPIGYRTTDAAASLQFALLSNTATNLALALNGATKTVTGSTGTTLTKVTPVAPGLEARFMWGWESINKDVRFVGYQGINGSDLAMMMKKAPNMASLAFNVNLELSTSIGVPYELWYAGTGRA